MGLTICECRWAFIWLSKHLGPMCPFVLFYWDKLNNFKVKLTFYFEIYGDVNIKTPF